MNTKEPVLAITMGEPAGIGGEILLKAWQALQKGGPAFVAIDDPARLRGIASRLSIEVPVRQVADPAEAARAFADALPVLALGTAVAAVAGEPSAATAPSVIASIERAVSLALAGSVSGVVTNPIQKSVLYEAGFSFPGHTEFIGSLTGADFEPVMMLTARDLRVAPVTIHVSLRTAIRLLTSDLIVDRARRTAAALMQDFGIPQPRLAILGLNPHAGEKGSMGTEDQQIIAPAIARLRAEGINAFGPLPPDAAFSDHARKAYDAAICMYHDQALIPVKTLDMNGGVNITLGLPIVRTSPDHGTALDIAGRGVANPDSIVAAIVLAAEVARKRAAAKEKGR